MDKYYLNLTFTGKCQTFVGRMPAYPGGHVVEVGIGCVTHEIMHALGFYHEHNRYDRDQYLKIIWKNIQPGYEKNFQKNTKMDADTSGTPYDPCSVMHYGETSFGHFNHYGSKVLKILTNWTN